LTDAFPANERGLALGLNQVAGIAGSFIGLVLGGLLGPISWRYVFLVWFRSGSSARSGPTASCVSSASAAPARSTGGATSRSPRG